MHLRRRLGLIVGHSYETWAARWPATASVLVSPASASRALRCERRLDARVIRECFTVCFERALVSYWPPGRALTKCISHLVLRHRSGVGGDATRMLRQVCELRCAEFVGGRELHGEMKYESCGGWD